MQKLRTQTLGLLHQATTEFLLFWRSRQTLYLAFLVPMLGSMCGGTLLWLVGRRRAAALGVQDGFLIVAAFWTVLGTAGAAPLYFADAITLSWTDAVFESIAEGLQEDGIVTIGKWGTYSAEDIAGE